MKAFRLFLSIGLLLALGVFLNLQDTDQPVRAGMDLSDALSDKAGEFATVVEGRKFHFPTDHGAHPEFKTEWWYFTGNVKSEQDRHFGYQLTLFRVGLRKPKTEPSSSEWDADSLMMGHLALSDPASESFEDFEKFARCAVGLAGFLPDAKQIWLEDWVVRREPNGWRLTAAQDGVGLDLRLEDTKPPVLQGDNGYSRKGPNPRQSSYYVSQTRLKTDGHVKFRGEQYRITGTSWFDHEWSSEVLAEGLVGWDWFSLQLDDSSEVMIFLLRGEDGSTTEWSSGSLIQPDGRKRHLTTKDFEVEKLAEYKAPSGAVYPSKWKLSLPQERFILDITPTMPNQEMSSGVTYWEGAVNITGSRDGAPLSGAGFVELTGYNRF